MKAINLKNTSILVVLIVFLSGSCMKESEILNSMDTQNVDAEVASSSYVSEGSGICANAISGISSTQLTGGRAQSEIINGLGDKDDRLKCAKAAIVRTGTKTNPAGTITLTFDPTCADKHGVRRSGIIEINYKGMRWMPGSYWSLKYKNFYRNDTHIEGMDSVITKLSSDSLHLQFQSFLIGGKVTFIDNKNITQEHELTREWYRTSLPANDEWHTLKGGSAKGSNKKGNSYRMEITKDLVEKISCRAENVFIAVSGTKEITVNSLKGTNLYVVNYGSGVCDNAIVVSTNGKEKIIIVNSNGN